jgi:hypothetical protein
MGNAHPYLVPSQEVRELELSGGVRSLPQVPLVERRQASAPDSGKGGASRRLRGAPRAPLRAGMEYCVCRRSASFLILFVRSPDQTTRLRSLCELRWVTVRRSAERVGGSAIRGAALKPVDRTWITLRSIRVTGYGPFDIAV